MVGRRVVWVQGMRCEAVHLGEGVKAVAQTQPLRDAALARELPTQARRVSVSTCGFQLAP